MVGKEILPLAIVCTMPSPCKCSSSSSSSSGKERMALVSQKVFAKRVQSGSTLPLHGLLASSNPTNKARAEQRFLRYLYVKPHTTHKSEDHDATQEDQHKTLFVANVSFAWTEDEIKLLFSRYAAIEHVRTGEANNCRFALVRFAKAAGMRKALRKLANEEPISETEFRVSQSPSQEGSLLRGILTPVRVDVQALEDQVNGYIAKFDRLEKEEKQRLREEESKMDADGFKLVSYKKSAKRKVIQGDEDAFAKRKKRRNKPKHPSKELKHFYRYQMREERREQLAELREKFEQDKQHIQRLKNARKFRPY